MSDAEAMAFSEALGAKLRDDTPEEIVGGLASLVLMREQFQSPKLYRAIMKSMALGLAANIMRREGSR